MAMNPRLLRPTPTGFDPRRIANLGLWLDASDAATVTLDGSNNVSQWLDKSTNGFHAGQTTAANRPDYASSINGRKVVTFAGFPERLTGTNPTTGAAARTVFAVFSAGQGGSSSTETVLDLGASTAANGAAFAITKEIGVRVNFGSKLFGNAVSSASLLSVSSSTDNVTGVAVRKNGTSLTETSSQSRTLVSGANYDVGGAFGGSAGYFLFGSVAEIIVYSRSLSASEITSLERYLSSKWGIALA